MSPSPRWTDLTRALEDEAGLVQELLDAAIAAGEAARRTDLADLERQVARQQELLGGLQTLGAVRRDAVEALLTPDSGVPLAEAEGRVTLALLAARAPRSVSGRLRRLADTLRRLRDEYGLVRRRNEALFRDVLTVVGDVSRSLVEQAGGPPGYDRSGRAEPELRGGLLVRQA